MPLPQASFEQRFVALSLEIQTQSLQRGAGHGWGLGIPYDSVAAEAHALLHAPRTDHRAILKLGRVDVTVVPETALATAGLLLAGLENSRSEAAEAAGIDKYEQGHEHKDGKDPSMFTADSLDIPVVVVGGDRSYSAPIVSPGGQYLALFLDDHRRQLGLGLSQVGDGGIEVHEVCCFNYKSYPS